MPRTDKLTDLARVVSATRGYFVMAGIFSLGLNLLFLAGPLYMLQVYDRVMASGSMVTLLMLTLALIAAYLALMGLDIVRARILARAGLRVDRLLAERVVAATLDQPNADVLRSQPLRDFDTVRQFITGQGVQALFDVPWAPLYIGILFVLHPWLGLFAMAGALLIGALALINELLVSKSSKAATEAGTRNYAFTDMSLRNAEVVRAMGMTDGLLRRWSRDRNIMLSRQLTAGDRSAAMSSLIKFVRMSLQSLVLALAAYLAIEKLASVGVMFAASMLLGRALQPVEQVVGGWRGFVGARDSFKRVRKLLLSVPQRFDTLVLPRPLGRLSVRQAVFAPPGARPILRGVNFFTSAGETLGVIGPSGAGKSTLARLLVGVLPPSSGSVRLDGADISIWPKSRLGDYLGYLPQDVELFADTVAANISRFRSATDDAVIAAARLAGVHEMILELPQGYDTVIGEGGHMLSGGYRQRIGLARAVFGNPSLVVLDEPSSSLDAQGDAALADCIGALKQMGTSVVVISHRIATIAAVDRILVLRDGQVEAFGERQEIIQRFLAHSPLRAVPSVSVQVTSGGAS